MTRRPPPLPPPADRRPLTHHPLTLALSDTLAPQPKITKQTPLPYLKTAQTTTVSEKQPNTGYDSHKTTIRHPLTLAIPARAS